MKAIGGQYRNYEKWTERPIHPRAAALSNSAPQPADGPIFSASESSNFCEVSELNEQIEMVAPPAVERDATSELSGAQWMVVDICVRSAGILGVPRSIGEIFGFVFCSTKPISFDDVVRVLKLSNGTASHGLRHLKRIGAVRTCYLAQDRRDYYVAETSLRKLVSAFFAENILSHLGGTAERMTGLRTALTEGGAVDRELAGRVDLLLDWNQQVRRATAAAMEVLS
jgi:DNA-binding transcriptional regulator GbsR (MarR family)